MKMKYLRNIDVLTMSHFPQIFVISSLEIVYCRNISLSCHPDLNQQSTSPSTISNFLHRNIAHSLTNAFKASSFLTVAANIPILPFCIPIS